MQVQQRQQHIFFHENSGPGYLWVDYADLLQQLKATPAVMSTASCNEFVRPQEKKVKVDQLDVANICNWPTQKALWSALYTIEANLLESDL